MAILGFVIVLFFRKYETGRCRIVAWFAITFAALSALGGLWGLVVIAQLSKRSPFDYGYEGRCFILGVVGLLAVFVWVVLSRKLPAFLTLTASLWIAIFWMLDLATL